MTQSLPGFIDFMIHFMIHRLHDSTYGSLHRGCHTHTIWVWNTLHDSFHEYHLMEPRITPPTPPTPSYSPEGE